jgi:putative SOS response-associated peptidase YedK
MDMFPLGLDALPKGTRQWQILGLYDDLDSHPRRRTVCGRYVSPEQAEIERFWHIGRHNGNPFGRRFNVSPTQLIPILRLDRATGEIELVNARWGLIPAWWKDAKLPRTSHNARSEEAATKPMWKGPLAKTRCLIPAVGWYEWKTVRRPDPATGEIRLVKQPHFFHLPDDRLFSFAGLMAMWKPDQDAEWQATCAVLTRAAAGPAVEVHDRMPVVLTGDSQDAWLDPAISDLDRIMTMMAEHGVTEVAHHPVNSRVNTARDDDEDLTKAVVSDA